MIEKVKQVYVCSPYSHPDNAVRVERYNQINLIAGLLHVWHRHAFILPITQSVKVCEYAPQLDGSFGEWKDRDLCFIDNSQEVWVICMDGWKESIGVQAEIAHARKLGKPIRYIDPHLAIEFDNENTTTHSTDKAMKATGKNCITMESHMETMRTKGSQHFNEESNE